MSVDDVYRQLREALDRDKRDLAAVRGLAERFWPVSAERPLVGKGGPVKAVLRRLMRWYVEPMAADQRAFNDAALKLIDDLSERVDRLTEAVRELENRGH